VSDYEAIEYLGPPTRLYDMGHTLCHTKGAYFVRCTYAFDLNLSQTISAQVDCDNGIIRLALTMDDVFSLVKEAKSLRS
jgi:hypothetical protein